MFLSSDVKKKTKICPQKANMPQHIKMFHNNNKKEKKNIPSFDFFFDMGRIVTVEFLC